jgi:alpha-beta hydrolase superfamily lysophospholipase
MVAGDGACGVVLLPPLGYEYWTTHHALRELAERLAMSGRSVLRIDYRGTGDSSGDGWDPGLLDKWKQDVRLAVLEMRRLGAASIALVGLRFGALLALNLAADVGADAVVAWIPVVSGRRYVRELQMLSTTPPEGMVAVGGSDARFVAGCAFPKELLSELSALSVDVGGAAARILVLDRPDKPSGKGLAEAINQGGGRAEELWIDGAQSMLDLPTEYATTPSAHLAAIVDWLGPVPQAGTNRTGRIVQDQGRFIHGGIPLTEEALILGRHGLVAIECAPVDRQPDTTILFLNTGSEPHVGPGRAWVEFARELAARGCRTIRVDFQGWGNSPDNGYAPGRPYDIHAVADTREIVEALAGRGYSRILLVGLCAGAWVALRECAGLPVSGILALNPQLYWQTGDPVWATMPESDAWCFKDDRRVWRDPARKAAVEKWLERIQACRFPIDFWFEKGDTGISYFRDQLGMHLPANATLGSLTINEFAHLDHPMHRHWHRSEAIDAIESLMQRLPS